MKVLLTGAFGNLGSLVVEELLRRGHRVTAFDVANKNNLKIARAFSKQANLNIEWGDIRNRDHITRLVHDADAVIHLAALIAPFSEVNPDLAHAVNVKGTEYILEAIKTASKAPLLVFSSSISVFGPREKNAAMSTVADPLVASDHYSGHKILCEMLVQKLQSPWAILRLAGMVDSRMRHSDPQQARLAFIMAADNKLEYIHPKDACTAIVNVLDRPASHRKIHLIGGGEGCQVTHLELLQAMMGAIGITLNADDLGKGALYAHWLDSSEAQSLLSFQKHTVEDFRRENYHKFRFVRPVVKPISPLIKKAMKIYLAV